MATPPRFPSLSPDQSQISSYEADGIEPNNTDTDDFQRGGEGMSSRPLSEITLVDNPPPFSISQIDGTDALEAVRRPVHFRIDGDHQARLHRALLRKSMRPCLKTIAKKVFFLGYFTSNGAMMIRKAMMTAHNTQMQFSEALGWTFLHFMMLIVLLVRCVWLDILSAPIGLSGSARVAAAWIGTSLLAIGLGGLPIFFI
ncbi:hypothetical protein Z517_10258 [Fonsecaea pedrosoi CBS 271.37]|uniref:Uncharacterized protein n=1 Tax=Fonsecaea pedrosoi CBS 271.37 TaxID=1442368 RepID=A0A0D2DD31_9EURO|nr:uncharacterized protein Z517_10258 [Fonsecaea pedrosoi CBS 271.37]KIW75516.1 hypothetical protein Z517_10258 [Fonsecaea pedrosoi CBS 271.37]